MRTDRPTLHEVAQLAGVSIATVSRVFHGTTATSESARARVVEAARQLGYEPPRRRARSTDRRHDSYGLIVPATGIDISELVLGCSESASQQGRSVGVAVTGRSHELTPVVKELVESVDGIVVVGPSLSDATAMALGRKLPVVLFARSPLPGTDSISVDDAGCAQRLTEHLLRVHHREHLVFVGDVDSSPQLTERYRGYRLAHAAAALPSRRPPLRVPLVEAAGVQVADEILRRRVRIDGVVCGNDELAMSIMIRLQNGGVAVPEDMAIVGWDDTLAARYLRPSLTTVSQPVRRVGRTAAELLHHRVAGHPPSPEPHRMPSELSIRASCGCAPSAWSSGRVTAARL